MDNKPPFFSVCIPNYNYAGYIGKTIQSVLDQTYPNFEIVILDNASTDNSWEVIQSYVKKDSRVIGFRNNYNVGFAPNLDRVVQSSRNEFIIVLSSDDLMLPDALTEYKNVLVQLDSNHRENLMIGSATHVIDSDDRITGYQARKDFHQIESEYLFLKDNADPFIGEYNGLHIFKYVFPRFHVPVPFLTAMFSRILYDSVGGYSSINLIGPDAHFEYKCMLIGTRVIFIDRPLFSYRIHNKGQISNTIKNLNINIPIDRYILSNAYTDQQLMSANLKREDFQKATMIEDCFKNGLRELAKGRNIYALRHLFFAWSAYTNLCFKHYLNYILLFLAITGPIGTFIINVVFKISKVKKV